MKFTFQLVIFSVVLGCSSPPPRSTTFEEAKRGDEAKRLEFLDQLLGKWVYDKVKNPDGYVKAWYYMPSATHKTAGCHCGACGREAVNREYESDRREEAFEREMADILKSLISPAQKIRPFYRESARVERNKYQAVLIVGDLFELINEDEILSTVEDYVLPYIKHHDEGMWFKEGDTIYELSERSPDLQDIAHSSLLNLYARSLQIEKIANRSRFVSAEYRREVVRNYLQSHQLFCKQAKKVRIIYDDEVSEYQQGIVRFLDFILKRIYETLKQVGLEHREIDRKTLEFSLEGF